MIFSSNIFIFLFLPIILAIYFLLNKIFKNNTACNNLVLLLSSLFFYLWGSGQYLYILITSIAINHLLAKTIDKNKFKKIWLGGGIVFNLGLLFYFKYYNFFYQQLSSIIKLPPLRPISLPVGISFFTFMAISYLVDIYQNQPPASLLNFSAYLSLFPHLVAGPIIKFQEISTALKNRRTGQQQFFNGIYRFSLGLGKKVIIADNLGQLVNKVFSLPNAQLTTTLAWTAAICYTFQIFFDFSGYSDMAIGLAKFFGFNYPENFNQPYRATSVTDFWQRWHITLTRWFRQYLYIPLGGNRRGLTKTYFNIFIVFFLSGLWHGANWTFIVWGIYYALLLIIERILKNKFQFRPKSIFSRINTFLLITIGWVLFRSPSLADAVNFLKIMFTNFHLSPTTSSYLTLKHYLPINTAFYLIMASIISFVNLPQPKKQLTKGILAIIVFIYAVSSLSKSSFTPFIYFQF